MKLFFSQTALARSQAPSQSRMILHHREIEKNKVHMDSFDGKKHPECLPLMTPVDDSNNFFCNNGDTMGQVAIRLPNCKSEARRYHCGRVGIENVRQATSV